MSQIHKGNAPFDGADTRGWVVGQFMPEGDIRKTEDVEIKWAEHRPGNRRGQWVEGEHRTTVCFLVSGKFEIEFGDGEKVVLERSGDYVMWGRGVSHEWRALEASVTITIRWPSISNSN